MDQVLERYGLLPYLHPVWQERDLTLRYTIIIGGKGCQPFFKGEGSGFCCLAVQVRAGRGSRRRCIRHLIRTCCRDFDPFDIDLEHLRDDLCDLDI